MSKKKGLMHVRVGNNDYPASEEDIQKTKDELKQIYKNADFDIWVTHHYISIDHYKFDSDVDRPSHPFKRMAQ